MMAPVAGLAEHVRAERMTTAATNPFVAMQESASRQIESALDAWRVAGEAITERMFLAIYGLPTLQAAVGIDPAGTRPLRKAAKSALHQELIKRKIAEIKSRTAAGALREAVIRSLLYVGVTQASIDERGFELTRRLREQYGNMSLADFKALVREQFYMLLIDQESALEAIPSMLPSDAETRRKAYDLIKQVLAARGGRSAEQDKRLAVIARLFRIKPEQGSDRSIGARTAARNGSDKQAAVTVHLRRRKGPRKMSATLRR
jgi:hypothetical protein